MHISCSYMASRKDALEASAAEQFELADRLINAEDAHRDFVACCTEAAMFFRAAAEKGHAGAQYQMGMMHQAGRGVEENCRLAAQWYRKAALQGHGNAMLRLAHLYRSGRGVRKDGVKAMQWRHKYAEQCKACHDELTDDDLAGFRQINLVGQDQARATASCIRPGVVGGSRRNGGPNNA